MPKKGKTKYVMSYAQKQWDNYSPYRELLEAKGKELEEHYKDKELNKMQDALTYISKMAGYEATKGSITIVSKRIMGLVYN